MIVLTGPGIATYTCCDADNTCIGPVYVTITSTDDDFVCSLDEATERLDKYADEVAKKSAEERGDSDRPTYPTPVSYLKPKRPRLATRPRQMPSTYG